MEWTQVRAVHVERDKFRTILFRELRLADCYRADYAPFLVAPVARLFARLAPLQATRRDTEPLRYLYSPPVACLNLEAAREKGMSTSRALSTHAASASS